MAEGTHFVFDKRRFPRVSIKFDVMIYSTAKVYLGDGTALDVSASGIRIRTSIANTLRQGTEIFITFTLPEGPTVDKIRGEIKGVIKSLNDQDIRLRFTEFKALDTLRDYIEKSLKE